MSSLSSEQIELLRLLLSALSSLGICTGVLCTVYALHQNVREGRKNSLATILNEYRDEEFSAARTFILKNIPAFPGSPEEKVFEFARHFALNPLGGGEIRYLRIAVHRLNDICALVDQGTVREKDFFRHLHPALIEMCTRLQPFILGVSTVRGSRWGMRLLRILRGAIAFHQTRRNYRTRPYRVSGIIVAPVVSPLLVHLRVLVRRLRRRPGFAYKDDQGEMATLDKLQESMKAMNEEELSVFRL